MVTHAIYDFLSLLPSTESLSSRGRRLHDTLSQRQRPTYSPDVVANVVVEEASHKLLANFVDDDQLVLAQGETKTMSLWFSNTGMRPVDELWLVCGPEDEICIGPEDSNDAGKNIHMMDGSKVKLRTKFNKIQEPQCGKNFYTLSILYIPRERFVYHCPIQMARPPYIPAKVLSFTLHFMRNPSGNKTFVFFSFIGRYVLIENCTGYSSLSSSGWLEVF